MGVIRVLTDCGTEYCSRPEAHDYQLYLALYDIEHAKTKANSPQANGICERFHRTILNEFYEDAFRRKICRAIEELQVDPDLREDHQSEQDCIRSRNLFCVSFVIQFDLLF
jgi:transposase InsO family protein